MTAPQSPAQAGEPIPWPRVEPECTCPPGWVVANFGWHRGPYGCPRYDLDVERRRHTTPEAPSDA